MNARRWVALGACVALGGCDETPEAGDGGIFSEGCPDGGALARRIGVEARLPGDVAVGTRGDYLLANDHAAFVVTAPGAESTYFHYGGIVADAVPMQGCEATTDDKLDEVGLVLGEFDFVDLGGSVLRAFRAVHAEVVSSGADGGPAHLRVTGVDDTYWLVESTLMATSIEGGDRSLSAPYGLEVVVDYVLPPDSSALRVEVTIENLSEVPLALFTAALLSFAPSMDMHTLATDTLRVAGFGLRYGMPWLAATDGETGMAWAVEGGNLGHIHISGINATLDVETALSNPYDLRPGEQETRRAFLSVGAGGSASATRALQVANPEPLPGRPYQLGEATVRVVDPSDRPIEGVRVQLQSTQGDGAWGVLDEVTTDSMGVAQAPLPEFATPWIFRVEGRAPGRDPSEATAVLPGEDLRLELSARGEVEVSAKGADGSPIPVRLALQREDGLRRSLWVAGSGRRPLPPGRYAWTATRGYEYAPVRGEATVPADGVANIEVVLERVVDTQGFLSVDTHVHSSNSPDSRTLPEDVLLHAAAHGLEVVVHTEHERIADVSAVAGQAGLDPWVASVIGEEVTAPLPEHMTMFPAVPDGTFRGDHVIWYGKGPEAIFAAMRTRSGGGINLINHPGYLRRIDWDRILAQPRRTDPAVFGYTDGGSVWSWDFDGIEVMNGHRSPFADGNGHFDDWQSMLNAGHRVIAVGCSDSHDGEEVGFPRTYFASPTDDVQAFDPGDLVAAFRGGAAIVSAGAFARVDIDGVELGQVVTAAEDAVDLRVHIEAAPEVDVTDVLVFTNCDLALSVAAPTPDAVVKLSETLSVPIDEDAHVTVAAFGRAPLAAGMPQYDPAHTPRVLTNPIYVDADGDGIVGATGGRACAYELP